MLVTPDAPEPPSLGGPCTACSAGEHCLASFPGGYCAASCGACAGTCVEVTRAGEQCLASCTTDSECRVDEGYLCDRQWHACMPPNAGTIVARDCGGHTGLGRDPSFFPPNALATGSQPSAVVGADGTVVTLYVTPTGLEVARIDAATRVVTTPITATGAAHPTLARWGTKLYATWGVEGAIALATSSDGGTTWSQPATVHEAGDPAPQRPQVIAGPGPAPDRRDVVYIAYASHGLRVRASRDGGATFGPAVTALAGSHGELAVGGDGLLYAISIDGSVLGAFGSGNQRVDFAASGDAGRSFRKPQRISRTGEALPFFFANPQVALDDRRKWIYLAYTRGHRDGRWDIALVGTKDFGKTFVRARIGDEPPCAIHVVPSLAVDATTGTLHVAWYDSRGMRFAHARCDPGLAACRQVGRINTAPLAAFSLLPGKSLAEHDSLVVDGARRLVHAVWMQPEPAGIRIVHAKAKLPYR